MGILSTNQGEDRQRAQTAFENAKKSGVKGKALDTLRANYDAAAAIEKSAKGK